jgi:crossover junction endodeoxyribonuclease RuvC
VRVLGIDPGSRFMGYGIVEEQQGRLVHVGHGVIRTDPDAALEQRLQTLYVELDAAMRIYRPTAVAVEGVFSFRNARSALILGHARGVALLVAAQRGMTVFEYPPARVKRSIGAGGAGGKDAVARMVQTFLGIGEVERSDASDALAVAICHLNVGRQGPSTTRSASPRRKATFTSLADRLRPSHHPREAPKSP